MRSEVRHGRELFLVQQLTLEGLYVGTISRQESLHTYVLAGGVGRAGADRQDEVQGLAEASGRRTA